MGANTRAAFRASGPTARKADRRAAYDGGSAGGPAPFVGILDQLSTAPIGAWSVSRRLTASYDGPLVRAIRLSDSAQSDFGFDSAGILNTSALAAWIGGSSARLVTIYDQVLSQNVTQETPANQPAYGEIAGHHNRGASIAADITDRLVAALAVNWSGDQSHALWWVGSMPTPGVSDPILGFVVGNGSFSSGIGINAASTWWFGGSFLLGGNNTGGIADTNFHHFLKRQAGGVTILRVDGVQIKSAANAYNFSGTTAVSIGGDSLTGSARPRFFEGAAWSQDITNDDQSVLELSSLDFYF